MGHFLGAVVQKGAKLDGYTLTTVPHLLSNFHFKDCLNLDEL